MRNAAMSFDDKTPFAVSRDWLVSREFIFRANNAVLSRTMRFAPDGTIAGYSHPNESFWAVVGGDLQIMNAARQTTCILSFSGEHDGWVSLTGAFIDVEGPAATQSLHHVEEKRPGAVPSIASFDLFDTLVARRCHEPTTIFLAVERKSGVADFAHLRHTFEMRLFGKRLYGLDDVYAALSAELGWSPQLVAKLKMLELMEEWDNLFPIAEVVSRFGPNDIVISDMYLPFDFIKKIVEEKCGLRGRTIILSNYGKHLGVVWPQLLTQCEITRHYGDNVHADIASPSRFGIPTEHVAVSSWSQGERVLIDIGLRDCAIAIREARLRGEADAAARGVRAAQLEMNLPLLVVASYFLFQPSANSTRTGSCFARAIAACCGASSTRWRGAPPIRFRRATSGRRESCFIPERPNTKPISAISLAAETCWRTWRAQASRSRISSKAQNWRRASSRSGRGRTGDRHVQHDLRRQPDPQGVPPGAPDHRGAQHLGRRHGAVGKSEEPRRRDRSGGQ